MFVGVSVGGIGVFVGVFVTVGVFVGVFVGGIGVFVGVFVAVAVAVLVGVFVTVGVFTTMVSLRHALDTGPTFSASPLYVACQ